MTLCDGKGCPERETCYRFKAVPNSCYQSYFVESPIEKDGSCLYWTAIREDDIVNE